MNPMKPAFLFLLTMSLMLPAAAQTRTTPVTVQSAPAVKIDATQNSVKIDSADNTVKVDPANNTVKAAQSGAWSVGVSNLPAVTIAAGQAVRIDPAGNAVEPLAHALQINPVSSSTVLNPGDSLQTGVINCAGYREIRAALLSSVSSASLVVSPMFATGRGSNVSIGDFNFAEPVHSITDQGNFETTSGICMFSMPVMSPTLYLRFKNNSTSGSFTISQYSWVYLVN